LWDIDLKTKKVSCQDIELINPCPFYTLDFVDANTTIEIIKKLPKNSRIKLKSKKLIHAVDFEKIKDSTKEQNTKEIVTQLVRDDSKKTISLAKEDFDALPNVHDVSIMEKLIKEFHSDKKLSDSTWKKLMEWVVEASTKCETASNGSIWSLESMRFDNLFSYGENNVIEFSKLRGIVGLSLYDIRQRYREIALRKVNGATGKQVALLLVRKYIYILGAAFAVAIPLAYYIIHDYTKDFTVKAPVGVDIFITGFILTHSPI
jgi:hypothetical protein